MGFSFEEPTGKLKYLGEMRRTRFFEDTLGVLLTLTMAITSTVSAVLAHRAGRAVHDGQLYWLIGLGWILFFYWSTACVYYKCPLTVDSWRTLRCRGYA